jgi:hypothetical protein
MVLILFLRPPKGGVGIGIWNRFPKSTESIRNHGISIANTSCSGSMKDDQSRLIVIMVFDLDELG